MRSRSQELNSSAYVFEGLAKVTDTPTFVEGSGKKSESTRVSTYGPFSWHMVKGAYVAKTSVSLRLGTCFGRALTLRSSERVQFTLRDVGPALVLDGGINVRKALSTDRITFLG